MPWSEGSGDGPGLSSTFHMCLTGFLGSSCGLYWQKAISVFLGKAKKAVLFNCEFAELEWNLEEILARLIITKSQSGRG